jgi:hypothetical protein
MRQGLKLPVWLVLLALSAPALGGGLSLTEYQVKSLFLLNFAKYVDWPSTVLTAADTPIIIGVISEGEFENELAATVERKSIGGRPIRVRRMRTPEDFEKCQILFIAGTERERLADILSRIRTKPILTVGETAEFLDQGGAINFVLKEGQIHLEINLEAARQAHLEISSKLLNVADVVKGKSR